jgi:hypothetical protein
MYTPDIQGTRNFCATGKSILKSLLKPVVRLDASELSYIS